MTIDTLPSYAQKRIEPEPMSGCWLWTGSTMGGDRKGHEYGGYCHGGTKGYAHRAVYELLVGPIPEKHDIDHLCRNRMCVNPMHLESVTRQTNLLRAPHFGSGTHCKHGHERNAENKYIMPNGYPACRACGRESMRRIRARKAA